MIEDSVLDGRRVRALGDLAVRIAACTHADQVGPAAVDALIAAGLPFARLYRCEGSVLRLTAASDDEPRPIPLALAEVLTTGQPAMLPAELVTTVADPGARAIAIPLIEGPGVLGVLVTGLDPESAEFVDVVANTATAAIANAQTREQDHRRIAELEELDAAKSDLFANASHELRTPLTLVSAPAEEALADTEEPLPPAQRERIRLVRRNASRLRRMLNNILDITRISSGGLRADRVATELGRLTREIAASFAPAIERGGLEFDVESPRLPRMAFVDREMWERIVLNLLSNALKFTLHGRVALRLQGAGDEVLLSVQDTGIGITDDQIPLLFKRFHRVRGNIGRTGEGAGIGLALVSELVALHNGTVSVHSSPGAGSRFEVRIPYGTGATSAPSHQSAWVREVHLAEAFGWLPAAETEPPRGVDDGPPVLVVEDNVELRGYLVRLLSPQWTVKSAADGQAALAIARATKPALVLTDVSLPRMNGLTLLNELRDDATTRDVPIILLSAQAGAEATADALHAGADDYLVKPFSSVELLARVRSSIELARLRAQQSAREVAQARFAEQLAEATEVREVLTVAVGHLGAPFNAESVTVVSWDQTGRPKVVHGPPWDEVPGDVRQAMEELRHQPGLSVTSRPADPAAEIGAGAGAIIDVLGEDTVVWLDLPGEQVVTGSDRNLLRSLCGQLGLALSRARSYEQQRTVAVTLQRSILGPAITPGGGFAVRYEPAQSPLEVGGDWYDVVDLPYGGTGLVVGDCVGRGLDAATVMGQLRSACRALLLQHNSPAATLSALDGFAGMLEGGACTTVLCAWLSPDTGVLTYSSAGHPPPIVVDPDGRRTLLEHVTSVPLAVRARRPRPEHTVTLAPGSTLLLYTDGLVERRAASIDDGIDAAADILVAGRRVPEEALVDRVLGAVGPRTGADDVAVLLYRQAAPGAARFARSFPADPTELRPARVALQTWLTAWSVDQDVVERAALAAGEAWTNALEHGYQLNRARTVHTTATVHGGELEIMVADLGTWRAPGPVGNRGRGIRLMEGVCDEVTIDTDEQGTTVRLVIRL